MHLIYRMIQISERDAFPKCEYDWYFAKIGFSAVLIICFPTECQQNEFLPVGFAFV